ARFNARAAVQDKRYFEGLPSPSAAAVVAAFVGLAQKYEAGGLLGFDVTGQAGLILAFSITALAAILMVSRFPYRSFKDRAAGERVRYSRFLLVPLVIAVIAIDPPVVLFVLFGGFALSGPIGWAWLKIRKRPRNIGGDGGGG
ncbi:MAG: CDP-diacylglycerol--serine O-phosphatidyltransferase, partial [Gammaproteobacteria bacterium]|nr:CDP-diacylglycerol--serine O-phosphatidyltransferase [Gammaproteobacteria bacterium]